ncbi:MAG: lysophospholipid acyltransferase family protein [bacterium]|nr:lysophospholipid acyltransferase family protein [bacterium]
MRMESVSEQGVGKRRRRSFLSRHPRLKRVVYSGYGLLFVPLIAITFPLYLVPRRVVYGIARAIGVWVVAPLVAEKVLRNVRYVYGERMTARRVKALGRKVSINVVWSAVDCYYLWVWWWRWRAERVVTGAEGLEEVARGLRGGKGLFMVTGHYHCFEIMPVYVAQVFGLQHGGVVARKFPSAILNWLNRRARLLHGIPTFYDQVREVMRELRENGVIGFLPDLHARKRLGVATTFYGKPTLTLDVHVRIAGQVGCPIVPAFMMRRKRRPWEYWLQVYEAVWVPRKPDEEQIREEVQRINDIFEKHIRRYPSGWVWFHNKWGLW